MLNQRPPGRTLLGFITTKRCVIGKTQLGQQSKSSNLMPPKPFANGPRSILLATWSSNCSKSDMNSIKNGLREICNLASLTWAWCAFNHPILETTLEVAMRCSRKQTSAFATSHCCQRKGQRLAITCRFGFPSLPDDSSNTQDFGTATALEQPGCGQIQAQF